MAFTALTRFQGEIIHMCITVVHHDMCSVVKCEPKRIMLFHTRSFVRSYEKESCHARRKCTQIPASPMKSPVCRWAYFPVSSSPVFFCPSENQLPESST